MAKVKKKITSDFTIVHNKMLRDRNLGATERGVLMTMLSLPDNWDFSIKGLTCILPDGYTKISTALKNLETLHYLVRERVYCNGRIVDWDYTFSDEPMFGTEAGTSEKGVKNTSFSGGQESGFQEGQKLETENQIQGNQQAENRPSNKINNIPEKKNKVLFDSESTNQSAGEKKKTEFSTRVSTVETAENYDGVMDRYLEEMRVYTQVVRENIQYSDYVSWIKSYYQLFGKENDMTVRELDELVGMIVRAICSRTPTAEICGQIFPREVIKSTMLKVSRESLDSTLEIMRTAGEIRNYERYFISTLFNETNGTHFKAHTQSANYDYEIKRMNKRLEDDDDSFYDYDD